MRCGVRVRGGWVARLWRRRLWRQHGQHDELRAVALDHRRRLRRAKHVAQVAPHLCVFVTRTRTHTRTRTRTRVRGVSSREHACAGGAVHRTRAPGSHHGVRASTHHAAPSHTTHTPAPYARAAQTWLRRRGRLCTLGSRPSRRPCQTGPCSWTLQLQQQCVSQDTRVGLTGACSRASERTHRARIQHDGCHTCGVRCCARTTTPTAHAPSSWGTAARSACITAAAAACGSLAGASAPWTLALAMRAFGCCWRVCRRARA
jgi:hypothetical protein